MDISYIINQLGEERENYFNAVSPPIIQTSNFAFPNIEKMREGLAKERDISCYTRGMNPTVNILAQKVAALEEAEDALILASGCAAISASVLSCIKAGEHIVCVKNPYSWTNKLMNTFLAKYNVFVTMVDGAKPENYKNAIQPNTKLFYMESPNSFTFELQDIEEICKIAKEHNITTIIDNSYATSINQQPLKMGCDIVVYSATKYFGGHSDLVAGIICASKKIIDNIFANEFMTLGGIISPNDAWLMIRGLRTLPLRLERVSETTKKVIAYLNENDFVAEIYYPFYEKFPQYDLAKKQMKAGTGLFTIKLASEELEKIEAFSNSLTRFLLAVSWGGHESLALPSCIFFDKNKEVNETPCNLVRFYVGLEEAEVLISDLKEAFKKLK